MRYVQLNCDVRSTMVHFKLQLRGIAMGRDLFHLTCAAWLMMFTSVFADIISSYYDVTYGCDIAYGIVLETAHDIRSLTQCSWRCDGTGLGPCLSVKYDGINSECYLNSYRLPFVNDTCTGMFEYAENIKSSNRNLINDDCTFNGDCWAQNSRCLNGKCQCKPGYSYKYANERCVTSCDNYGSTFTLDPGYTIVSYDPEDSVADTTAEACQLACEEAVFDCLACSYDFINSYCQLYNATAHMVPLYVKVAGYNTYQRNCQ